MPPKSEKVKLTNWERAPNFRFWGFRIIPYSSASFFLKFWLELMSDAQASTLLAFKPNLMLLRLENNFSLIINCLKLTVFSFLPLDASKFPSYGTGKFQKYSWRSTTWKDKVREEVENTWNTTYILQHIIDPIDYKLIKSQQWLFQNEIQRVNCWNNRISFSSVMIWKTLSEVSLSCSLSEWALQWGKKGKK